MSGSWSNSYQTVITLPTGATSGARIVIDGTNDRILVYDTAGELVESVAASAGTDAFGNPYVEGFASYSTSDHNYFAQLTDSSLVFGATDLPLVQIGGTFWTDLSGTGAGPFELFLSSGNLTGTGQTILNLISESTLGAGDAECNIVTNKFRMPDNSLSGINNIPVKGVQASVKSVSFTALTFFSVAVTFATPFGATPAVTTSIANNAAPAVNWQSRAITVTSTGFLLLVYGTDGVAKTWSNVPVSWIATPQTQ